MREMASKIIQKPVAAWEVTYRCDGCGRLISREDHEDGYAHELTITLDTDECVNFFRQRDYCPACLDPVWRAINELVKADPDSERDRDYE